MENVTQALYMAFGVLIFVLALSISIMSFSQVRATADILFQMRDRENYTKDDDDNYYFFYSSNENNENRVVGLETIVPTLYRAYNENYKVIFKGNDMQPYFIFKARKENDEGKLVLGKRNYIDLKEQNIAIDTKAEELITALLYEPNNLENNFGTGSDGYPNFQKVEDDGLYYNLKGKKITEKIGEYYDSTTDENISDNNKTKKRIITYIIQN